MNAKGSLEALRRDIDSIDDAIQDLIMRRTELVEQVRDLKRDSKIKIRPSREAEILYRLVGRQRGRFPKRELVVIWRHLITATLAFEGPFSTAVYGNKDETGYWDLARDHFASFTPMSRHGSMRAVIDAVHRQDATVGVLPMPRHDDADPWWRHLVTHQPETPRIIARLPFAEAPDSQSSRLEALAICPVALMPTGRDRSFFVIDMQSRMAFDPLAAVLSECDLPPTFATLWSEEQRPETWLYLIEVDDFLTDDDARLGALAGRLGKPVNRIVGLGGYAKPLSAEEMEPNASPLSDEPPQDEASPRGEAPSLGEGRALSGEPPLAAREP
jgi:chorismate mutase / prephenate dehydratase